MSKWFPLEGIMPLSIQEQMLVEQRVANDAKSAGAAYLLWLFLGLLSAHRLYLGRPLTAILQIASYFILIGFIWWLLDGFLISGMIRDENDRNRERAVLRVLGH